MGIFLRTNILHLKDVAALWAALDWAVARHLFTQSVPVLEYSLASWGRTYRKPDSDMRVSGVAGAASILLVTERLDDNRIVKRACIFLSAIDFAPLSLSS